MRVTVVGAGIMGVCIAARLARAGVTVQVLDGAESAASGTTATSFARLSAFGKEPRSYFEFNAAGMAEHERIKREYGAADIYHSGGTILLAEDLDHQAERFRAWGYDLRYRDGTDVERELGLPAHLQERVLHAPDEGCVDPVPLTRLLAEDAEEHGALLRFLSEVTGLDPAGRGWSVTVNGRERIDTDAVVNAAGRGAAALAAAAGSALTLTPSSGLLLRVATKSGASLGRMLHTPRVSIRPAGPGQVMIRSDQVDARLAAAGDHPDLMAALTADLLERAARIVPELAAARVTHREVGHRVIPDGGLPSIGGGPGLPGYYEAVAHSGIILGPLVGRLLAEEITTGRSSPLLAPYRPRTLGDRTWA